MTPAPPAELAHHLSGPRPDIEGVIAERGSEAVGMVLPELNVSLAGIALRVLTCILGKETNYEVIKACTQ